MVEHAVIMGECVQCYTEEIDLGSRNCYFLIMCLTAHERQFNVLSSWLHVQMVPSVHYMAPKN